MKRILKKLSCLVITLCLIASIAPGAVLAAEREFAANVFINDIRVGFENAPYMQGENIFIPLEEACKYMNISLSENNGEYTLIHGSYTVRMGEGNLIVYKNEASFDLSAQSWNKGGVVYVPSDLFTGALEIEAEFDAAARSINFHPNIYKIYISEQNAAKVEASDPDKDLLKTGEADVDGISYNENLLETTEISLYYKFDLSQFSGKVITDATFTAFCSTTNYLNTYLSVARTEKWEKGSITYKTAPKLYEGTQIKTDPKRLNSAEYGWGKNYLPHSVKLADWANDALYANEPLCIKLLGMPGNKTYDKTAVGVKGVNTPQKAYISVVVEESFNFPQAEETRETEAEQNVFEKLAFLAKLGIVKEDEEFPADLSTGVTRREFISYAMRLMNKGEFDENAVQIFSDVEAGSGAYGEICEAAQMGIISSGGGVCFRPDEIITYNEAFTIIGRILGYGIYAEQNGGFAQGFVSAAIKNDLTDGVKNHGGIIGFDSMFNLLFNALEAPMFETSVLKSGGESEFIFNEDTTLLSIYWDLKKVEGTIEGNEYTNLDPALSGADGKLVINGKTYNFTNSSYNALLGYKVEGYCDKDDNILYLGADKNKNKTETINIQDIIGANDDANGFSFTYEEKGKSKSERVDKTDIVIYNGKSVKASDVTKKLLGKKTGSIVYLNDNVVIITAYTTVVVYDVNTDDEVITDKYAPYDNTLRLKNCDYYTFRDESGYSVEIENLVAGNVISVAISLDKKIISGEVSKTKITGKISAITDENEIEVNGNLYKTVGDELSWVKNLRLGTEGNLYMDIYGNIASFDVVIPTGDTFGYLLKTGPSGGSISNNYQAGFITTAGEHMMVYELADKVKVDGESLTEKETYEYLTENDVTKKQGVVFALNQNKEVTKIDTATLGEKEIQDNTLAYRYDGAETLHFKPGRLGDSFYWNLDTALNVMKPTDEADIDSWQYFRNGIQEDKQVNAEVYSIGTKKPTADIVIVQGAAISTAVGGDLLIAGRQVMTMDEDGYYVRKLYYYTPEKASVVVNDESLSLVSGINPGDIIRIGTDFNGELTALTRYYDYKNQVIESNSGYAKGNFNQKIRIYGGTVVSKYDSYIKFTDNLANLDETPIDESKFRWINIGSGITKYEVEQNEVIITKATAADFADYEHVPYAPSGILLQTRYGQTIDAGFLLGMPQPANTGIYKIEFLAGENASGIAPRTLQKNPGETVVVPENTYLHNDDTWGFDVWEYNGRTYNPGEIVNVEGDMSFVAKWKYVGRQYAITFDGNGATSGSVDASRALGGSVYVLPENPDTPENAETDGFKKSGGYKFTGWEYSGNIYKPGDSFTMPESEVTFKAVWTPCWDGARGDEPTKSGDVYQISKGSELAWFADFVNAGNPTAKAELTGDITLNLGSDYEQMWSIAIGNSTENAYKGTFNGNGHTIYGLYNVATKSGVGGLFGQIGTGGVVENIRLKNVKLVSKYTTANRRAGLAPIAYYSKGTIRNCITEGIITNNGSGTYLNGTAGIVSTISSGARVEKCISRTDIISDGLETSPGTSNTYIGTGGIVGCADDSITSATVITQCGNEGTIYLPQYEKVGGIVGLTDRAANVEISQCYNIGDITASNAVAGIAYIARGNHLASPNYNRGTITVTNDSGRGVGLIANVYTATSASKCGSYTTGKVILPANSTMADRSGLAYYVQDSSSDSNKNNPNVHNFIYAEQSEGITYPVGKRDASANLADRGVKKTLADIKTQTTIDTLNGWTEGSIYTSDATLNEGYPIFTWQKTFE